MRINCRFYLAVCELLEEVKRLRHPVAVLTDVAREAAKETMKDTALLDKLERKLRSDHRLTCGYCVDNYEIASGLQVEAAGSNLREAIGELEESK